jgi:drug/metabolite transporter (DMT)-like permease
MAGIRFTIAGAVLFAVTAATGAARPTLRQWRNAVIIGAALMCFGNGVLGWTEQFIPSGFAAIVVAIVPFWMVILDWLRPGGQRPSRAVFIGLALGTIGLIVLVGPMALAAARGETLRKGLPFAPVAALMFSSLVWAAGSIYSRYADLPRSAVRATSMEMFCGGILLLLVGLVANEPASLDISRVSARSIGGLLYLITAGSFVGFTAYVWLLTVVPAPKVSTHAYVNPVVAVLLGSTLGAETLAPRTFVAAAIIIVAVALITTAKARSSAKA